MKRWPPLAVDLLRECWSRGLSAQHCAWEINARCGTRFTRSAVLGKVHRLHLAERTLETQHQQSRREWNLQGIIDAQRWQSQRRRKRPALPRRAVDAAPPAAANSTAAEEVTPPPHSVTLNELLPHHCRWPFGDPRLPGFHFCGARRAGFLPYCAVHAGIAYRIEATRKERAA